MMKMKVLAIACAFAGAAGLAACEKAGETVDNAIDKVTNNGETKPGDGAFEKAGEAVDHAVGAERKDDPADTISDAVDGDPATKPD